MAELSSNNRILILLASWTKGSSGGDIHALQMADEWSRLAEVHVVIPSRGVALVQNLAPDVQIHTFETQRDATGPLAQSVDYLRRLRQVRRLSRSLPDFDIALAGSHFLPDVVGLRNVRSSVKAGYVYHLSMLSKRGTSLRSVLAVAAERLSLRFLRRTLTMTIVCNKEIRDRLSAWPNVIITKVGFNRRAWPPSLDFVRTYDAVFCGRLVPTKGIDDFVTTCEALYGKNLLGKAIIIGTGPEESRIAQLIKEKDLSHVIELTGYVSEERKREILMSSKLMIFPSYEEGWGIAVCEGLAAGCVVLAYDLPVYAELFEDAVDTVPLKDQAALAARAACLLEDPVKCRELATRNIRIVDQYDYRRVASDELRSLTL